MLTRERQTLILEILRRDQRVVAKALSADLGLSEDTIRRDLRNLAATGQLQRVHGGALPASPAIAPLIAREEISPHGKVAIGRIAASMIRQGQIVMLDGGTTAVQLARHLAPTLKATIMTHSPIVAIELAQHPLIDVELIGGRLFRHSMVAVGTATAEVISRIRADIYFMGVTGVHPEIGLTTGDGEEAAIKRALCHQSAETIVLASFEKLGAVSPYNVMALGDIDAIIVEADIPDKILEPYRRISAVIVA